MATKDIESMQQLAEEIFEKMNSCDAKFQYAHELQGALESIGIHADSGEIAEALDLLLNSGRIRVLSFCTGKQYPSAHITVYPSFIPSS